MQTFHLKMSNVYEGTSLFATIKTNLHNKAWILHVIRHAAQHIFRRDKD